MKTAAHTALEIEAAHIASIKAAHKFRARLFKTDYTREEMVAANGMIQAATDAWRLCYNARTSA